MHHDIPLPPSSPGSSPGSTPGSTTDEPVESGPFVRDPFASPASPASPAPPAAPGQLGPRWKRLFIAGWVGVIVGFGCIWQAGRVAGIAPWWLGPETNRRVLLVVALPFAAPLIAILFAAAGSRWAVYAGVAAGLISMAISLGDLDDYPGLAAGQAVIGLAGLMITVACFAGRLRRPARPR